MSVRSRRIDFNTDGELKTTCDFLYIMLSARVQYDKINAEIKQF